jgi:hypothetical protein
MYRQCSYWLLLLDKIKCTLFMQCSKCTCLWMPIIWTIPYTWICTSVIKICRFTPYFQSESRMWIITWYNQLGRGLSYGGCSTDTLKMGNLLPISSYLVLFKLYYWLISLWEKNPLNYLDTVLILVGGFSLNYKLSSICKI